MKIRQIILASALLVSVSNFAQKDELKKLKKIYDKDVPSAKEVEEYKMNVASLEKVASDEADKMALNYYKVNIPQMELASKGQVPNMMDLQRVYTPKYISELAKTYSDVIDFEKKSGKKTFTDDINEEFTQSKPIILNLAIEMGNQKKFKESASIFHSLYLMDKKDVDQLYYAASYATNGQDYDTALEYYNELIRLNYIGDGMIYYAVNKTNKQEESFGNNKTTRDTFVKVGTYEKPRDEKIESKKAEIYKNVALILVQQGKTDEAMKAVSQARIENPDDANLILTEADLYLKLKDITTYKKLINEALDKDPNNADLVYNLGVISSQADQLEDAIKYYKKAISIKPDYFNAYLNLSEVMLRGDEKYVEEMNKLTTSDKDNKRYAVIKAEREKNFQAVLPYLEKAVELKPDNEPAAKTLMSVYNALEMTDKYKALKAKMNN
ncbi:MAG: tetratricopeptide repeat protein [Flavobacterium sp.]|uniref:tetratricopeptide repeat protein n=1 Tax=Flavobacterium sp. TaxID=239 RepID=UPI003529BE7A